MIPLVRNQDIEIEQVAHNVTNINIVPCSLCDNGHVFFRYVVRLLEVGWLVCPGMGAAISAV